MSFPSSESLFSRGMGCNRCAVAPSCHSAPASPTEVFWTMVHTPGTLSPQQCWNLLQVVTLHSKSDGSVLHGFRPACPGGANNLGLPQGIAASRGRANRTTSRGSLPRPEWREVSLVRLGLGVAPTQRRVSLLGRSARGHLAGSSKLSLRRNKSDGSVMQPKFTRRGTLSPKQSWNLFRVALARVRPESGRGGIETRPSTALDRLSQDFLRLFRRKFVCNCRGGASAAVVV